MNLLFLGVAVLFCFGYYTSSTDASKYIKVGCFKDNNPRALPELLASYRGKLDWNNLEEVVKKCAQEAKTKNYMYFGIQFYGECWSGATAPKTYDRYGKSSSCTSVVGKAFANLVYRFVGDEQECINYSVLNKASRSATLPLPVGISPSCDKGLSPGWYRFQNPAGNQMASTCVPSGNCDTVVTGWLNSTHPKMTDGIVSGKVCFNWKSHSCCQWSQDIKLRDCGRFYVYKLGSTGACPMGFCASTSSV